MTRLRPTKSRCAAAQIRGGSYEEHAKNDEQAFAVQRSEPESNVKDVKEYLGLGVLFVADGEPGGS
jgi:hypothetical protein